jgi:hypothetical protein
MPNFVKIGQLVKTDGVQARTAYFMRVLSLLRKGKLAKKTRIFEKTK